MNTTSLNVFDKYDKETQKDRVSYLCNSSAFIQKQELRNRNRLSQKKRRTCRNGLIIKHKEAYSTGCIIPITWSDTLMFSRLNVCLLVFSCNAEEGKHFCWTSFVVSDDQKMAVKLTGKVLNKTTCWSSEFSFLFSINFKINRTRSLLDQCFNFFI